MLSAPTKIAKQWFGDDERAIATAITSLAVPLGCLIGFVMPVFWIKDIPKNQEWTDELRRSRMEHCFNYTFW